MAVKSVETDTKAVLRKFLSDHQGHHNAVTESTLSDMLGLTESTLRSEIARLRDEGNVPIQNFRDGEGYFIPSSEDEFREQIGKWNEEVREKRRRIESHIETWDVWEPDVEVDGGSEILEPEYDCNGCDGTVKQSEAKYPKDGNTEGPLCAQCYGNLVMDR